MPEALLSLAGRPPRIPTRLSSGQETSLQNFPIISRRLCPPHHFPFPSRRGGGGREGSSRAGPMPSRPVKVPSRPVQTEALASTPENGSLGVSIARRTAELSSRELWAGSGWKVEKVPGVPFLKGIAGGIAGGKGLASCRGAKIYYRPSTSKQSCCESDRTRCHRHLLGAT